MGRNQKTVDTALQRRRVSQARANLVLDAPFFGALALKLQIVEDSTASTFWVDGSRLGYNPAYVAELTIEEIGGIMAHEVLHVANGHCWRRDGRDQRRWNAACDYAINPVVLAAGFQLPEGRLENPAFEGKSAEWIYSKLPRPGAENENGDGGGDGAAGDENENGGGGGGDGAAADDENENGGGGGDGTAGDENENENGGDCGFGEVRDSQSADPAGEKASWDIAILQAAQAAQAAGQLGGGLERLLDKIRQPTIDWRTLLRRFVQEAARSDYSWKLPNPRYCPQGLYLPALKSEQMAAIVIGLDTSGSINHAALAAFGAEIQAIVEDCVPECTFVVACDAKVQGVSEFGPGESICLEARGGGGTDFKPVFDWVSNEGVTPSCLIYLTDLCGEFPANEPEYPVLWVSPQREGAAPFGEIIHMEIPD